MFRTAELDMSAGCVTEKVFTLCSFPVMVAVVQQRGEKGRRYRRRKEGEVSRVRHLRSILSVDRANLREREKKGGRYRGEGGGGG